jgi:hypothetical protein
MQRVPSEAAVVLVPGGLPGFWMMATGMSCCKLNEGSGE